MVVIVLKVKHLTEEEGSSFDYFHKVINFNF